MPQRFQFSLKALLVATLMIAVAAVPCGYLMRRPVEVPVAGTVTLDGAPLAFVVISLFGADGHRGECWTDACGRFAVPLFPGSYQVTVTELGDHFSYIGDSEGYHLILANRAKLPPQVTERYGYLRKSRLVADVRAGKRNNLVLGLTTPQDSTRQ